MVLKSHKSRIKGDLLSENLENLRKERKSEFPPPSFVKRRRNQTFKKREREILITFLQFQDKKENIEINSYISRIGREKLDSFLLRLDQTPVK